MRTTVLVRRQHRRDKIEAVKVAAVDSVKKAGRKGLAAGAAGAEAAGQVAVNLARSAKDGAAEGAERGLALFVRTMAAARSRIAVLSAPINTRLATPRVSAILGVGASLAGTGCAVRIWQFGPDWDGVALGAAALVAGAMWIWPKVFSHTPEAEDDWALRTERVVAAVDRAGTKLPLGAAVAIAGVALFISAPVINRWVAATGPSSSRSVSADTPIAGDDVVQGSGRVVGPGLVRIGNRTIRLNGVSMLDFAQDCHQASGFKWACGTEAKQAFEKLVRNQKTLRCEINGGANGISHGDCQTNAINVAGELVRQGHAFAEDTIWSTYSNQQAEAQEAKAGLWAGEPERAEDWRARLFAQAATTAPGGCPIKGRIRSGRKSYVLPHSADYKRVTVREDRGERWFCSKEEAEAAGFGAQNPLP